MEFIPEECRETPVITIGGVKCSSCSKWKPKCKEGLTNIVPQATERTLVCPPLLCPKLDVPRECQLIETYNYNGIKCEKCPVAKVGCPVPRKTGVKEQVACPMIHCELQLIPTECKETPYFEFMGRKCTGCPRWRTGCNPSRGPKTLTEQTRSIPDIGCPMFKCDGNVPVECREVQEYQTSSGRTCRKCDTWREGCREQERVQANNGLQMVSDRTQSAFNQAPDTHCPVFPCSSIRIPNECREEQPFQFNGKTCFRCPRWRTGCEGQPSVDRLQPQEPQIACPLIRCDLPDLPPECFRQTMMQVQGRMCHDCPQIKDECLAIVPPRPIAMVDPRTRKPITDRAQGIQCPLQMCPLIYIPKECREIETFEFQGRTCPGCPRYKAGCLPVSDIPQPTVPSEVPQIPKIPEVQRITCPDLGCPLIDIPNECRELPKYDFKGTMCDHCPRWLEGCVPRPPINDPEQVPPPCPMFQCEMLSIPEECVEVPVVSILGRNCSTCPRPKASCFSSRPIVDIDRSGPIPTETSSTQEEIACPLVACPRIFIPKECRDEKPYQFRGKTCFGCPVWRTGCVPGSNQVNGDGIANLQKPVLTTSAATEDRIACPVMRCTKIHIPVECREETPYLFMNTKTCYRCPKWRKGCVPGERKTEFNKIDSTQQITSDTNTSKILQSDKGSNITGSIMNDLTDATSGSKAPETKTNTISDLKGVLPVNQIVEMMNSINCPPLPCPAIYIPRDCQETVQYVYNGRLCDGCPRWRDGCSALGSQWQNSNFDG